MGMILPVEFWVGRGLKAIAANSKLYLLIEFLLFQKYEVFCWRVK
jgi:hypothetical protein